MKLLYENNSSFLIQRFVFKSSKASDGVFEIAHIKLYADANNDKFVATIDQMFSIILRAHEHVGHGGLHKTYSVINDQYCNITRDAVTKFIELCVQCQLKRPQVKALYI